MAVNPAGAVALFDGGVPRIVTARNPIGVTGGQLVFFAGTADVVSSGADSFIVDDIVVSGLASGTSFNGIVVTPGNTASGTTSYVSVATRGAYILAAGSEVYGGKAVEIFGADNEIRALGSHIVAASYDDGGASGGRKIGRAYTDATSGTLNFAIVELTP